MSASIGGKSCAFTVVNGAGEPSMQISETNACAPTGGALVAFQLDGKDVTVVLVEQHDESQVAPRRYFTDGSMAALMQAPDARPVGNRSCRRWPTERTEQGGVCYNRRDSGAFQRSIGMRRRDVLALGLSALTALVGTFATAGGVAAQTATATATPTATATSTPTPTVTVTPPPDLVAIYRAEIDARNRGDITTAMSFYTDDAVQVGGPCAATPCVGKPAVQRGAETQIANHAQLTIVGNPQVSGNVLTSREEIRSDGTRAAGIDRQIFNVTETFIGNRISRRVIENDLTDAQTAAFVAAQAAAARIPAAPAPPKTGNAGLMAREREHASTWAAALVTVALVAGAGIAARAAHARRSG